MSITLTPNVYKNLKWAVLPKNKIDTVNIRATINDNVPAVVVDSRNITSGKDMHGRNITLPISDSDNRWDHVSVASVSGEAGFLFGYMYGPYLGCVISAILIKGSYQITLPEPFVGTPQASFTLSGNTRSMQDTSGDTFQSAADAINSGVSSPSSAITLIKNNKNNDSLIDNNASYDEINRASTGSSKLVAYSNQIPMTPFIQKPTGNLSGVNMTLGEYALSDYRPKTYQVFPEWHRGGNADDTYNLDDFFFTTSLPNKSVIVQGPQRVVLDSRSFRNTCVKIASNNIPIWCTATKINDYTIQIDYQLPARYVYLAHATRRGSLVGSTLQDPIVYGWIDLFDKITIETKVTQLNKDTVDITHGWDESTSQMTGSSSNKNPLDFSNNELITMFARWGNNSLWTDAMSNHILSKYHKGKHIVECDVYAKWAVKYNIKINSEINVQLHDGTFISRDGTTCTFEVKNIEKRFNGNEFIYCLKLLEK